MKIHLSLARVSRVTQNLFWKQRLHFPKIDQRPYTIYTIVKLMWSEHFTQRLIKLPCALMFQELFKMPWLWDWRVPSVPCQQFVCVLGHIKSLLKHDGVFYLDGFIGYLFLSTKRGGTWHRDWEVLFSTAFCLVRLPSNLYICFYESRTNPQELLLTNKCRHT